jgi:hypothetical protein
VPQIIVGQKIGEEFSIFKHWIDRVSEKASVTTKSPHRVPIGRAISPDLKVLLLEHSGFHAGSQCCVSKKETAVYIAGKTTDAISFYRERSESAALSQSRIF